MNILLASKSKWRRRLAEKGLGCKVENAGFDFDEKSVIMINNPKTPEEHVKLICREKLNTARKNINSVDNLIILCYDTVVVCDDCILEKPKNKEELVKMIEMWGKENKVTSIYTGVAIGTLISFKDIVDFNCALKADVKMVRNFTDNEYNKYLSDENVNISSGGYIVENLLEIKIAEIIQGSIDIIQGLPIEYTKNCISEILKK